MPLIVMSGIPCSGKTLRAQQLRHYFEAKGIAVHLINEESLLIVRDHGYKGTAALSLPTLDSCSHRVRDARGCQMHVRRR